MRLVDTAVEDDTASMKSALFDFPPRMLQGKASMVCEEERTRLIGALASLLREHSMPDEARAAGLTLIGWLARRMPGEGPSQAGVDEMKRRVAALADGESSTGRHR